MLFEPGLLEPLVGLDEMRGTTTTIDHQDLGAILGDPYRVLDAELHDVQHQPLFDGEMDPLVVERMLGVTNDGDGLRIDQEHVGSRSLQCLLLRCFGHRLCPFDTHLVSSFASVKHWQ